MALPSSGGSERPDRAEPADPFLEFESETSEIQARNSALEALMRAAGRPPLPTVPPPLAPPPALSVSSAAVLPPGPDRPRPFAMSPTVGFALGVAGLVMATVAYYQLAQFLSGRERSVAATSGPALSAASGARGPVSNDGRTDARPVRSSQAAAAIPAPASVPPATVKVGWVHLESAIDLSVIERGRSRGTTGAGRLTLPAGVHELELFSTAFEVRQSASVTITAGQTARMTVALPEGLLSVNALPWADVWIDDRAVGTTPLANLVVPVGSHEVLWRHPTLGERRQTVAVKARTPAQIGVDLSKRPW